MISQIITIATPLLKTVPQTTDSVARLMTLTRLYIILYRLANDHGVEGTWGTARQCEQRNNALFEVLHQRLKTANDLVESADLLTAMYSLLRDGNFCFDERRETICTKATNRIVKRYLKSGGTTEQLTESAIIRCLADLLQPFGADESDEWFLLLRDTISRWNDDLTDEAGWPMLPVAVALRRIDAMEHYASLFLDEDIRTTVERARCHYADPEDTEQLSRDVNRLQTFVEQFQIQLEEAYNDHF